MKQVEKCRVFALDCIRQLYSIDMLRPALHGNRALLFDLAELVTSGCRLVVARAAGAIASALNFTECCLTPPEMAELLGTGVIKVLADQVGWVIWHGHE